MLEIEAVFSQYYRRVYRFALALTRNPAAAEEIASQTFFQAMEKADSFRGDCDVGTWLCSIARNEFLSQRRKQKKVAEMPASEAEARDPSSSVEDMFCQEETHLRLHRQIHSLEEPFKEVFMLRAFGELKFAQIAAVFGRTENWARVTYYRARQQIQRKIREDEV